MERSALPFADRKVASWSGAAEFGAVVSKEMRLAAWDRSVRMRSIEILSLRSRGRGGGKP